MQITTRCPAPLSAAVALVGAGDRTLALLCAEQLLDVHGHHLRDQGHQALLESALDLHAPNVVSAVLVAFFSGSLVAVVFTVNRVLRIAWPPVF
ncbi:hypothetical protein D3C87_1829780 [compost metagenome]